MSVKPGTRIPSGSSVFVFVEGVSYETFTKDEDFRSGTISTEVAGKVRIAWDSPKKGDIVNLAGVAHVYVEKTRLTKIAHKCYVLDASPDTTEMGEES